VHAGLSPADLERVARRFRRAVPPPPVRGAAPAGSHG
jgi:hypothetical protein